MNLPRVPFAIEYPIKVLDSKISLENLSERERKGLFSRNLYSSIYGRMPNPFFRQRYPDFIKGGEEIVKFLSEKPLSISLFGSALFSPNPEDFDYLAIVEGNLFSMDNILFKKNNGEKYKASISIKGIDHLAKGYQGQKSSDPKKQLEQIIDRTTVSLYNRHLPIFGYDFFDNKNIFLNNIDAQVSDLIGNTHGIFYSDNSNRKVEKDERIRKILSRVYQSATYLEKVEDNPPVSLIRKEVYLRMSRKCSLEEGKSFFDWFVDVYRISLNRRKLKTE